MLRVPLTSMVSRVFAYAFNDCRFDVVMVPQGSVVANVLVTISPTTVNPVKVPKDVTLGCAGVCNVPVTILATRFEAVMLEDVIEPVVPFAEKEAPFVAPVTANDVNVPSEVTLGCAGVCRVPVTMVATRFEAVMLDAVIKPVAAFAEKDPDVVAPVTANDVNVPSEVTLGCAGVCRVPVMMVATRFEAVMLDAVIKLVAPVPLKLFAYTVPVAAMFPVTSIALEALDWPTASVFEIIEFDVLVEVSIPAMLMVSPGPPMLMVVAPPPFFPIFTVSM